MSQLYTSQPTVNRLLTTFSSLFRSATRPTRHLLAWLLIAQLALESAPSVRCLFRQFLSKQTDASLNISTVWAFCTTTPSTMASPISMAMHMSIAWQESKALRDTSSKLMTFYPLKLSKRRWGIETNYYEQKMFWELGSYKVRTKTAIEHLLNLTNAGHALMKILPCEDERLSAYQDKSPQELRHALSQQIHKEVFFATLVSKAQSSINSSVLLKALQTLVLGDEPAA